MGESVSGCLIFETIVFMFKIERSDTTSCHFLIFNLVLALQGLDNKIHAFFIRTEEQYF